MENPWKYIGKSTRNGCFFNGKNRGTIMGTIMGLIMGKSLQREGFHGRTKPWENMENHP